MTVSKILCDPCPKHINTAKGQESLRQLGLQVFMQYYVVRNDIEVHKVQLDLSKVTSRQPNCAKKCFKLLS